MGDLTPTEGTQVMALVGSDRRMVETSDLEARVAALAERARQQSNKSGRTGLPAAMKT